MENLSLFDDFEPAEKPASTLTEGSGKRYLNSFSSDPVKVKALVPASSLPSMMQRFEAINRKLVKSEQSPLLIDVGQAQTIPLKVMTKLGAMATSVVAHEVEVTGSPFNLGRFDLLAKVNHSDEPVSVQTYGDFGFASVDEAMACKCDHCNTVRDRKKIFFLRDRDTKEVLRVGGSCVSDLLEGLSPERVATAISVFEEAERIANGIVRAEEGLLDVARHESGENVYVARDFLALVELLIERDTFVSRTKANEMGMRSTAEMARDTYIRLHDTQLWPVSDPKYYELADKHITLAVNDLLSKPELADFHMNLLICAQAEYIGAKHLGILAYLPSYAELVDKENREKALFGEVESEFVGQPSDKHSCLLFVRDSLAFPSQYGVAYKHLMNDEHGNAFNVSSSKPLSAFGLKKGHWCSAEVKVKEHYVYEGTKTTKASNLKPVGCWESKPTPEQIEVFKQRETILACLLSNTKSADKALSKSVDTINADQALKAEFVSKIYASSLCARDASLMVARAIHAGVDFTNVRFDCSIEGGPEISSIQTMYEAGHLIEIQDYVQYPFSMEGAVLEIASREAQSNESMSAQFA